MNEALAEVFGGQLPGDIKRLRWKARVRVAEALTLFPVDLADSLGRLAKVRDDFAHGNIDDLDDARAADDLARLREWGVPIFLKMRDAFALRMGTFPPPPLPPADIA